MQIAPETMHQIAALFKGFDDPTRIHILSLLIEGERCVGEIADTMNLTQSAVSHQLRILKAMKLIKYRRDGKNLFYSLADDHVLCILQTGLPNAPARCPTRTWKSGSIWWRVWTVPTAPRK